MLMSLKVSIQTETLVATIVVDLLRHKVLICVNFMVSRTDITTYIILKCFSQNAKISFKAF